MRQRLLQRLFKRETWAPQGTHDDARDEPHFATRERANDFSRLMQTLPDPDPVLRKMGRTIAALRELLVDGHMESVWSVRCSTVAGAEWRVVAGADGARAERAANELNAQLELLDVPRIIEEMMTAVAYGFAPLEVLWDPAGSLWGIGDIVGKPQEWFEFDAQNRLVLRGRAFLAEPLPPNRFLVVRHRASYTNPYGDKLFSKCYWPVTFKKNGWRWWTVFVEKYGGAFMYGKYPPNADDGYKHELLTALEKMVSDAVAIAPEDAQIAIEALANKGSVTNVHAEYIRNANNEISKTVLGQTLTTEIGETGSYAAAAAHNLVRADLAKADRRRVRSAFNRLSAVWSHYNYGADVAAPVFEFALDRGLQADRATRDSTLYQMGWRPRKGYLSREYGMHEDDFDLVADERPQDAGAFSDATTASVVPTEPGATTSFVASEADHRATDAALMDEFGETMMREAQKDADELIDVLLDAVASGDGYSGAFDRVMAAYARRSPDRAAALAAEVRYAASQIGALRG